MPRPPKQHQMRLVPGGFPAVHVAHSAANTRFMSWSYMRQLELLYIAIALRTARGAGIRLRSGTLNTGLGGSGASMALAGEAVASVFDVGVEGNAMDRSGASMALAGEEAAIAFDDAVEGNAIDRGDKAAISGVCVLRG
ncbi:hypothetical protein MRB53_017926 [Persea americana]|uniref:Uncharacterized protein n=1 Tax=Persea americana TaxID=3435 RepID=A0ACC2M611_PERAE|nr:hypothetical protein MRB53_017926 [Persea americana]